MKGYIELKIRKSLIMIISIILLFICGIGGFYAWRYYHPYFSIQISASTAGENLKIEAPHISFAGEIPSSIELKLLKIWVQHESMCKLVKENYTTSDIKLDMNVTDGQTTLKYYGTAIDLNNETINFNEEVIFDFALDMNKISYKR